MFDRHWANFVLPVIILCGSVLGQDLSLLGTSAGTVPSTNIPALFSFKGTSGIDTNRGGSSTAAKLQLWNYDSEGPMQLTAGSLVIISGEWPNHPTTGTGYHANCTAPCSPAFVDNNGASLTKIFTEGSGSCYDGAYNHNIYYEANILSTVTYIEDAFPALISNDVFASGVFYNVATSAVLDTSSCKTGITPASNTAPNITGTALTLAASGELVWVEVDDYSSLQANTVSSITVPANCSLGESNQTPSAYGLAYWTMYCIPTSTSFTPTLTVAQTTHDTFAIYAAAFKSGAGGAAKASGPGILASSQYLIAGTGAVFTDNIGCPASTTSVWVTDDSGSLTSVTDSASNSYAGVASNGTLGTGGAEMFNSFSVTTTGMPNTFTLSLHTANTSSVDLITIYCGIGMTQLDTPTAGGSSTQLNVNTVYGTSGTCTGDHCTGVPQLTPGHSGVLFFESCQVGSGPLLQAYNLAGNIADDVVPSASADIVGGDADDYSNGNMSGHYYANSASAINFGWNATSTSAAPTCIVQGGR